MLHVLKPRFFPCLILLLLFLQTNGVPEAWGGRQMKVGVGKAIITPQKAIWMGGYASRKSVSEGKEHDLYAKVFAFEDEDGTRSVWLTSDLLGLPRSLSLKIAKLVLDQHGVPRERLMLSSSHTHCGPVVRDNLSDIYGLSEPQAQLIGEYTDSLPGLFLEAIGQAIGDLEPCRLSWGIGEAGFAMNRRQYTTGGVINGRNPIGPVDHDVPVLRAERMDGSLKGVAFGYACHATTNSLLKLAGDYPGFAQIYLEEALPGTLAMFAAGCGGDINPLPRGTIEHAKKYGRELADGVLAALDADMALVEGPLAAAFEEIPLALSEPPTREDLEKQLGDKNVYIQRRAKSLAAKWDKNGGLDTTYPYPVQVWRFGDSLQFSTLGGEVVVDYSRRLKHELGAEKHWVVAYSNDVMAYIPTLRVLREGGYEGETSMIYYGFYGKWAPPVEEDIVASVHKLTESLAK